MSQIQTETFNQLLQVKDSYEAPAKLLSILYDKEQRETLMLRVLEACEHEVSVDTFRKYFEDEHADRKYQKQDFTPASVARLITEIVSDNNRIQGSFYDACAGTGGLTIAGWHKEIMNYSPFTYKPSMTLYHAEELSDRAIPFLIFNLAMRGMNAIVLHVDVLSRNCYGAFFIQNDKNDPLAFSSINRFPYNDLVERMLGVKFIEMRYEEIHESPRQIRHLAPFL